MRGGSPWEYQRCMRKPKRRLIGISAVFFYIHSTETLPVNHRTHTAAHGNVLKSLERSENTDTALQERAEMETNWVLSVPLFPQYRQVQTTTWLIYSYPRKALNSCERRAWASLGLEPTPHPAPPHGSHAAPAAGGREGGGAAPRSHYSPARAHNGRLLAPVASDG